MAIPERAYDRLQNLWRRLGLSQEDMYYAIENDQLRTAVWMPMRYMERGVIKDGKFVFVRHECREGFIGVRPQDFHRICSTGRAKLRIFRSVRQEDHILRLAYEPPQPGITVRIHDLVVLQEDRKRFEQSYDLPQDDNTLHFPSKPGVEGNFRYSNDYRHITLNGHEYRLGDVQARIVEQLHDAARSRHPWVHGKTLIYESGSHAERVRDIFKHQRKWRELIKSDDRGYYRLNIPSNELQNNREVAALKKEHTDIQARLDRLVDLLAEGVLVPNDYRTKREQYKVRQHELVSLIHAYDDADNTFGSTMEKLMKVAMGAHKGFMSSNVEEKRELLNFVFSNLSLKGENLCYSYNFPFGNFQNMDDCVKWRCAGRRVKSRISTFK